MVAWRTKVGLKCLLQAAPANEIDSVLETLSMGPFWLWGMSQSFVAFPKSGRDVYMHKYFEFELFKYASLLISRRIMSLNNFILILFTVYSLCAMLVNIYWPLFISRKKWEKLRTLSKNENVNKKEKTIITRSKFARDEIPRKLWTISLWLTTTLIIFELKLCNFHSPVTLKLCSLRQIKRISKMTSEFSMKT